MNVKGCENVLVGKSLLGQYARTMHIGNSPWCMPFPAQALSGRLLAATGQNCTRNHSNQKFQCSRSPQAILFSTADSAFKSMCILVTVFPSSSYTLWFLFYLLSFKTCSLCPSQKWYTHSTSTYFSSPRNEIFSNATANTDTYTPLGFKIIIVMKD